MSKRDAKAPVDDSDLEDLLQHKGGETVEMAPLNLDHLTKGQLDVPRRTFAGPGMTTVASAHCKYLCYMYPKSCGCLSVVGVGMVMIFLIGAVLNPTETFGVIKNDYTNIQSEYDLSLGKIDHWCLKGDNDSCRCEDPLEPNSRIEYKTWNEAHKSNKNRVEAFRDSELLDVAFIGESLVEEMDGQWMGRQEGEELQSIGKVFKKQFKREKSGMEGVALGIAGDTSPNVLWRLLHGEMPADFNPRVWWVVLGMNDLGRMQCSEEVVVLGILRVVEEIRSRKPDAKIVINSMLPMADLRGGAMPQTIDYRDAFKQSKRRGGRDAKLGPNANPALYARRPGGAGGVAMAGEVARNIGGMGATVTYQRPSVTTTALRNRHKGVYRGGQTLAGGRMPPNGARDSARGPPPNGARGPPPNGARGPPPNGVGQMASMRSIPSGDGGRKLRKHDDDEEEKKNTKEILKKTKAEKKALKKFMKKIKKDPINPKLNADKTKIKARDPKKLFLKKNKLPLWTSINSINQQLRKFADKHDQITFFDATPIFAERDEGRKYVLQSDKISVRGHPTLKGFEAWEEAMANRLKKMFEKDDEELAKEAAQTEQAEKEKQQAEKEKETKKESTSSEEKSSEEKSSEEKSSEEKNSEEKTSKSEEESDEESDE